MRHLLASLIQDIAEITANCHDSSLATCVLLSASGQLHCYSIVQHLTINYVLGCTVNLSQGLICQYLSGENAVSTCRHWHTTYV